MQAVITFALSNFTLTFFVLGLVAALIAVALGRRPVSEEVLAWFLFFSCGVNAFYNFVMHVFFGEMAARFIGWADSPFQAEVGYASLGMAALGFLAFRGSFDMRLAALVAPACFLWGAAIGHVVQMVSADNFAPGNAGVIFYTDILLPIIGFVFLWWRGRTR